MAIGAVVSPWRPLSDHGSGSSDDARDPRRVGESLTEFAQRLGGTSPAVLSAVFTRWEEIVGVPVSDNAWPVSLARGILVIGVEQPGWATQLRFMTADILARVVAVSGVDAVDRIEIKVGPRRPSNGVT
jgi:predicted nucleic acid-binding Zn ribbon protein